MKQEAKSAYIEIINTLGFETENTKALKKFIDTYDGSDTPELHEHIIRSLKLMAINESTKAEAEAYRELETLKEEQGIKLEKIADEITKEVEDPNLPIPT